MTAVDNPVPQQEEAQTYRPSTLQRFLPFIIAAVVPFILGSTTENVNFWWKALITVVVLVVVARLAWKWTPRGELTHREDMRLWRTPSDRSWAAVTTFGLLVLPFILVSDFNPPMDFPWAIWSEVVNQVLIFAMGAAAFNLLVGYPGQISLAHVAFLALGTIVGAIVGVQWSGGNFWLALPAAAVAGAVVGAISGLPALRLKHLYLLLATFGFHFVMMLVWREYLQEYFGFVGIRFKGEHRPRITSWLHWLPGIDPGESGEFVIDTRFRWYWVIMPLTVASLLFMVNVVRTREGRAFAAVRDRDVSASLLGINVARSKLMAFAVSSAVVSMSGVLASFYSGARGEDSFDVQTVLDYAIIIVVGGFSSIQGAIFGSAFFLFLPEWFEWAREELWFVRDIDFLSKHHGSIDYAFKGFLVVIILMFKPDGLAGLWRDFKGWLGRRLARSNP
ncbi:MAG: branched-chain amino acid ABC transporter permease [bacterium]|nr:branched-chain amino acid ABC transporter permease [bacterium]